MYRSNPTSANCESAGRTVVMAVRNTCVTDARVMKEAATLTRAGWRVTVLAIHQPGDTVREEERDGVIVRRLTRLIHRLPRRPRRRVSAPRPSSPAPSGRTASAAAPSGRIRGLSTLVRSFLLWLDRRWIDGLFFWEAWRMRPDRFHAHDVNTLAPLFLASRLRRRPLVYDAHEISADREGWSHSRLWHGLEKQLGRRSDGFITTNETRAAYFRKQYGLERVSVVRNVPPLADVTDDGRLHRALGVGRDTSVLLYQGGLQSGRGLSLMLEAFAGVEGAHLAVIGFGRLRPSLEQEAARLGLSDRVTFLGRIPHEELLAYTAGARAGLQLLENTCLNHYTACSNKLHEYLMAEVPVIASDLPEMRRVVEETGAGRLVPPGEMGAVRQAMREMVGNREEWIQMKESARRHKHRYHWGLEEPTLLKLYGMSANRMEAKS
ncbi:glycosyltransferase family 4 protein [Desmospora profundinema]|uniref:Glycosyltransferase involved in cell wall biosynthesis n=1 Tax=Desmospora profundinema TaxID=1571184 RepID=A0ABU1IQE4_9BACL|nr:glycosyltransferase family 4 protein [Desmospora profundinema]MDR6227027.1 glycosyltransferase involved in cell wall biosynthesis [Desmospora profundinema]